VARLFTRVKGRVSCWARKPRRRPVSNKGGCGALLQPGGINFNVEERGDFNAKERRDGTRHYESRGSH
jgi:hypothetical protein